MRAYYYDTCARLVKIFTEHCNLSPEQFEEISAQFIYLVSDIQDHEPMEEIEKRVSYMRAAFAFLFNTKELTLKEHAELEEMLETIRTDAEKEIVQTAIREGTVL